MAASKKDVFVNYFVKTKKDAKSFVWNYFGILTNKADGSKKDPSNVYCLNCFENNEIKMYKDTVSTTNLAQHLRDCHSILLWLFQ
jgi:BED zinc finger